MALSNRIDWKIQKYTLYVEAETDLLLNALMGLL